MSKSLYLTDTEGVNLSPHGCLGEACAMLLVIVLCILLTACKTQQAATAPEVHTNRHDSNNTALHDRRDSIYIHDSIIIREKGDTVTRHVYHTEYRDRWKTDSVTVRDSVIVRDSIPYPVEVPVNVPVRNGYTRFTSWFFWIVIVICLLWGAWKVCDKIPACKGWTTAIKMFLKIL